MANYGMGIGAFVDGLTQGARLGQGMNEAEERRKAREEQRAWDIEDRAIDAEDRKRRIEQEDYSRTKQREGDARDARMRGIFTDSIAETEAAQAAGAGRPGRGIIDDATPVQRVMPPPPAYGQQYETRAPLAKQTEPPASGVPQTAGGATPAVQAAAATAKPSQKPADRAEDFMALYARVGVPKVVKGFLENGDIEKAKAYQAWAESAKVKDGMRHWANATQAASMGDEEGFFDSMVKAYNAKGYFDDGRTVVKNKSGLVKDGSGRIVGARLTFKDEDGKEYEQAFNDIEDIYRAGVQVLSPEAVFEYGFDQVKQADAARAEAAKQERGVEIKKDEEARSEGREIAKEGRSARQKREEADYTHEQALERERVKEETTGPQSPEAYRKRVEKARSDLMANDLDFADMSPEEQDVKVEEQVRRNDAIVQKAAPVTAARPERRRTDVLRRPQPQQLPRG